MRPFGTVEGDKLRTEIALYVWTRTLAHVSASLSLSPLRSSIVVDLQHRLNNMRTDDDYVDPEHYERYPKRESM